MKSKFLVVTLIVFSLLLALPGSSLADHAFLTDQDPYITLDSSLPAGSTVTAIISSGETYHDFLFEGIPDGIGIAPGPMEDTVDVYVNHEQSTVPFQGSADFQDASVSKLTLDTSTGAVVAASVAIGPENGYLRFCSASMAGRACLKAWWARELVHCWPRP